MFSRGPIIEHVRHQNPGEPNSKDYLYSHPNKIQQRSSQGEYQMQSLMTKCHRGPREGDTEDAANKSAPVSLDGQVIHVGDQTVLELTLNALT